MNNELEELLGPLTPEQVKEAVYLYRERVAICLDGSQDPKAIKEANAMALAQIKQWIRETKQSL